MHVVAYFFIDLHPVFKSDSSSCSVTSWVVNCILDERKYILVAICKCK